MHADKLTVIDCTSWATELMRDKREQLATKHSRVTNTVVEFTLSMITLNDHVIVSEFLDSTVPFFWGL